MNTTIYDSLTEKQQSLARILSCLDYLQEYVNSWSRSVAKWRDAIARLEGQDDDAALQNARRNLEHSLTQLRVYHTALDIKTNWEPADETP